MFRCCQLPAVDDTKESVGCVAHFLGSFFPSSSQMQCLLFNDLQAFFSSFVSQLCTSQNGSTRITQPVRRSAFVYSLYPWPSEMSPPRVDGFHLFVQLFFFFFFLFFFLFFWGVLGYLISSYYMYVFYLGCLCKYGVVIHVMMLSIHSCLSSNKLK